MTHSPPVPPGSRSPYPLVEPPHSHTPKDGAPNDPSSNAARDATPQAAELAATTPTRGKARLTTPVIAGALVAGAAAVVATVVAVLRARRSAPKDTGGREPRSRGGAEAEAKGSSAKDDARSKSRREGEKPVASGKRPAKRPRTTKTTDTKGRTRARRSTTADDETERSPRDASHVSMGEDFEVRYWMSRFGVGREALQRAVDAVGSAADAVERELRLP